MCGLETEKTETCGKRTVLIGRISIECSRRIFYVDRVRRPLLRAERRRTRPRVTDVSRRRRPIKKTNGARDPGTDSRFGRWSLFSRSSIDPGSSGTTDNVVSSNMINMHVRYRVRTSLFHRPCQTCCVVCVRRTSRVSRKRHSFFYAENGSKRVVRFSNTVLDDRNALSVTKVADFWKTFSTKRPFNKNSCTWQFRLKILVPHRRVPDENCYRCYWAIARPESPANASNGAWAIVRVPAHYGLKILAVARAFTRVSEMTNVSQSHWPPGRVRISHTKLVPVSYHERRRLDDRSYTNENRERVQWLSLCRRERKDVWDIKTKSGYRVLFKKNFEYLKY